MIFKRIIPSRGGGIFIGKKDLASKNLIKCTDVFADIGNVNLFSGKSVIRPEELEPLPTSVSFKTGGAAGDGRLVERNLDSRMRYTKDGTEIAILCAENQSNICNAMPVRDMGYLYAGYNEQVQTLKQKAETRGKHPVTKWLPDGQKLKPVITFILNYSGRKWEHPLSLMDILDLTEEKVKQICFT